MRAKNVKKLTGGFKIKVTAVKRHKCHHKFENVNNLEHALFETNVHKTMVL